MLILHRDKDYLMRRRAFLSGVAVGGLTGISGCLDFPGAIPGREETTDAGDTPSNGNQAPSQQGEDGQDEPRETAWEISPLQEPERIGIDLTENARLSLLESSPIRAELRDAGSPETPPRIRVAITNPDQRETSVEVGRSSILHTTAFKRREAVWDRSDATEVDPAFSLVPIGQSSAVSARNGACWIADSELDPPTSVTEEVDLAGETQVVQDYHLLLNSTSDCYPHGTFWLQDPVHESRLTAVIWDPSGARGSPQSRFRGTSVPPLPSWGTDDETIGDQMWYHEADDAAVFLEPSPETVGQPWAEIEMTLFNSSDQPLGVNPSDWGVFKFHDGNWHRIAPWFTFEPLVTIMPGESKTGTISFDNQDDESLSLGAGRYGAYFYDSSFAALFEILGDELPITPTDAVDSVERQEPKHGTEIRVRSEHREEADRPSTLRLERVDEVPEWPDEEEDGPDPVPVVREQLVNEDPLRNVMAFGKDEEVDVVTLHTGRISRTGILNRIIQPIDDGRYSGVMLFEGETYIVQVFEHEPERSSREWSPLSSLVPESPVNRWSISI